MDSGGLSDADNKYFDYQIEKAGRQAMRIVERIKELIYKKVSIKTKDIRKIIKDEED